MAVKKTNQRRPVRVIEDRAAYLLQVAPSQFFFRISGDGRPLAVRAPSVAAHLSYREADDLCTKFRAMGYAGCVVVDIYGAIVDGAALESERQREAERSRNFWGS